MKTIRTVQIIEDTAMCMRECYMQDQKREV